MNKKIKIILGVSSTIATLTLMTPMFTSCSITSRFVFGNFQSYMSPEVKDDFDKQLKNINWQNFASNDEIPTYLTNKTINAAIASNNMIVKLQKDQMIEKVQWENFELLNSNNEIVRTANDLKGVVNDLTYRIATEGFKEFEIDNLLDYCLPYFLQNFVFVYRGEEIPELNPNNNPTFTDIFNAINKDPRFQSSRPQPKVMMVKDSRTMYGVSQILDDEQKHRIVNINPDKGMLNQKEAPTIKELREQYFVLKNQVKNFKMGLNSDSNVLINKIVLEEIQGAFMYNGDAAFAALGGDYAGQNYGNKKVEFPTSENFHVVVPKNTLIALDGVILNSKNDEKQREESLKLSYDLTMLGANVNKFNDWNKPLFLSDQQINKLIPDSKNINIMQEIPKKDQVDDKSNYLFLPTKNYEYVNYTPTLSKLYDAVSDVNNAQYFKDYLMTAWGNGEPITDLETLNKINVFARKIAQIIKIDLPSNINISNVIEKPLNNLTESNMKVAFTELVNEIPG